MRATEARWGSYYGSNGNSEDRSRASCASETRQLAWEVGKELRFRLRRSMFASAPHGFSGETIRCHVLESD